VQPQAPPEPVKPATHKTKSSLRWFLFAKPTIIGLVVVGFVCAGIFMRTSADSNASAEQSPSYPTVLPKEKSIGSLGGWKRVSPPEKDPVFAFSDTLDGVSISISEQPLPASFKNDTDNQVAGLAQKFSATDKLETGAITAYIGTSSKGPQSVIFTKNDLLILIKSEQKVADTSWTAYIRALQ